MTTKEKAIWIGKKIDFLIRYLAVGVTGLMWGLQSLLCLMAFVTGNNAEAPNQVTLSIVIFILTIVISLSILLLALDPEKYAKFVPGPSLLGRILVRLIPYVLGLGVIAICILIVIASIWEIDLGSI